MILVLALLLFLILSSLLACHTHIPNLKRYTQSPRLNSPASTPLRIIHLSDVHLKRVGVREKRAAHLVHKARPRAAVLTGDFLDRGGQSGEQAITNLFNRFGNSIPIVIVRGNSEFVAPGSPDPLKLVAAIPNVRVLSNEVLSLEGNGRRVHLIGLDPYVDSCRHFAVERDDSGLCIQGGGSWVDCFYNLRRESELYAALQASRHYAVSGRMRVASASDLGGIVVCTQMPLKDSFYRLTFGGGGHPVRFSSHGGRLDLGERFSEGALAPCIWYNYRIEVEVLADETLLRGKVWRQEEPEPQRHLIECGDSSGHRIRNGTIGFWTSRGGGLREYAVDRIYDFDSSRELSLEADDPSDLFEEHFVDESPWSDLARLDTRRKLEDLMEKVPQDGIRILLCHDPDVVRFLDGIDVDIVLAGHTHGGQIRLPLLSRLWSKYPDVYQGGNKRIRKTEKPTVIVNKGLGTSGIPLRLGARCEVVLLEV